MHKSRAFTKSSTCRIHAANKFAILNDPQEESKRTVALLRQVAITLVVAENNSPACLSRGFEVS
jgi:hypothetical protein